MHHLGYTEYNKKIYKQPESRCSAIIAKRDWTAIPDTKYSIWLVAKRGLFKKDRVDVAAITFL